MIKKKSNTCSLAIELDQAPLEECAKERVMTLSTPGECSRENEDASSHLSNASALAVKLIGICS